MVIKYYIVTYALVRPPLTLSYCYSSPVFPSTYFIHPPIYNPASLEVYMVPVQYMKVTQGTIVITGTWLLVLQSWLV